MGTELDYPPRGWQRSRRGALTGIRFPPFLVLHGTDAMSSSSSMGFCRTSLWDCSGMTTIIMTISAPEAPIHIMNALHTSVTYRTVRSFSLEMIRDLKQEYRSNEWRWEVDI
jgi:hypothetical protein